MADDQRSELDALDPEPIRRTLSDGTEVEVVRLKTRQFFRLLKVLTHGAGNALLKQSLDFTVSGQEFISRLVGLVLVSIPDAEQEAIDFLQSMVRPAHLPDKPVRQMSKQEREQSDAAWSQLFASLYNPELDDLLDLITDIVQTEAPHIQELGKRAAAVLEMAAKTGQTEETPEPVPAPQEMAAQEMETVPLPETLPDPEPVASLQPSISSAPSMDGLTSGFLTSPSPDSSRSPVPSENGAAGSLTSDYG